MPSRVVTPQYMSVINFYEISKFSHDLNLNSNLLIDPHDNGTPASLTKVAVDLVKSIGGWMARSVSLSFVGLSGLSALGPSVRPSCGSG